MNSATNVLNGPHAACRCFKAYDSWQQSAFTAIAGHWNHHRRDFQDFLTDQQQRDGHDTSLWLLAESADTPVSAVIARAPAHRAWITWLGALPEARGRGIATQPTSGAPATPDTATGTGCRH